jgi:HAD superfamily hydrolase (TIGR01509 family)
VTQTLIFDLSEVLIAGLVGIEKPLAARLLIDERTILPAFGGLLLHDLCCGFLTEDEYLAQIIQRQGWHIEPGAVKLIIRHNFQRRVPGMVELVIQLAPGYELILLSDHAAEWVDSIKAIHPFLSLFKAQFFSFELKQTKREPSTFQKVLKALERQPSQCLVIDDNPQNVSAAASIGIPGICFTNVETLVDEVATHNILIDLP